MSSNTHGPVEESVETHMHAIGRALHEFMPEGYGFTLLMFKFGAHDDGRMNYMSNAPREDMITAMKELIANFEGRGHAAPGRKQ